MVRPRRWRGAPGQGRSVPDTDEILRLQQELVDDPRSLRFVQLAEALRVVGRGSEAEAVLEHGLSVHPGLNSARLVQAQVWSDSGRVREALATLDELYARDAGNVRLVSMYLRLLVEAGRHDEARILLERAEMVGVPAEVRQSVSSSLEAALWSESSPGIDDMWPPAPSLHPLPDDPSAATLPSANAEEGGGGDAREDRSADPFATTAVALRLERAGRLSESMGVWEQIEALWPDRHDIAAHVADLRFRIESGAETLQGELMAFGGVAPPPEAARPMLERWRRFLGAL